MTEIATMGFHKGTVEYVPEDRKRARGTRRVHRPVRHFDPPQTPGVRQWIMRKGGFPITNFDEEMLKMDASAGLFRRCGPQDVR